MALRTAEDFEDAMASEMGWRRTELQALRSAINGLPAADLDRPHGRMLLRAGVALTYSHWEGFAKQACQHYLDYVAIRRLKYKELRPELVATALRPVLERSVRDQDEMFAFAADVLNVGESRARMPRTGVVDTGSNLRFDRLIQILESLGVSTSPFETRENLINVRLCDSRNKVAHGEFLVPKRDAVLELISLVLQMLQDLRNSLENLVSTQGYRAAN